MDDKTVLCTSGIGDITLMGDDEPSRNSTSPLGPSGSTSGESPTGTDAGSTSPADTAVHTETVLSVTTQITRLLNAYTELTGRDFVVPSAPAARRSLALAAFVPDLKPGRSLSLTAFDPDLQPGMLQWVFDRLESFPDAVQHLKRLQNIAVTPELSGNINRSAPHALPAQTH